MKFLSLALTFAWTISAAVVANTARNVEHGPGLVRVGVDSTTWLNATPNGIRGLGTNNLAVGIDSPDMTCGVGGSVPTAGWVQVSQLSIMTFWYYDITESSDPATAMSPDIVGGLTAYVAPANNPTKWTKIYDYGRWSDREWVTQQMRSMDPKLPNWSFFIPSRLPGGKWILRVEVVNLNGAAAAGPKFYPSCVQIEVSSRFEGAGQPWGNVTFPGTYSLDDAGLKWDVKAPENQNKKWPAPGGPSWEVDEDCNPPSPL